MSGFDPKAEVERPTWCDAHQSSSALIKIKAVKGLLGELIRTRAPRLSNGS
jgi:hypothetical protein